MISLGLNKIKITHFLVLILALSSCIVVFFPFMSVLSLAGIFAFVLHPFVLKIQQARWVSLRKSTLLILFIVFFCMMVPFGLVGVKITNIMKDFAVPHTGKEQFIAKFSESTTNVRKQAVLILDNWGLSKQLSFDEMLGESTQKIANFIFNLLSDLIAAIPNFILGLFIFILALFFFLTESQRIGKFFQETQLLSSREISILVESLKISCNSAVFSSVVTGIVQATIVALGAQWANMSDFSLVFTITFFFSFIPIVGAGPVAFTLALLAFLNQHSSSGVILIITGSIAGIVDNIIRPLLIGQKDYPIHPFISLLSLLGGIIVFGVPGLFIGPVLVQVSLIAIPQLLKLHPFSTPTPVKELASVQNNVDEVSDLK